MARASARSKPTSTAVLSLRALNRATLARQLLLQREKLSAFAAVERLLGLQAQLARPPFIGLWSRLRDFEREALLEPLRTRRIVRATMMRGTLHLVTASDYLAFRSCLQPMLTAALRGVLRERAKALEVEQLTASARRFFDQEPRTFEELRERLRSEHPRGDERAMGYAVRMHLPLVQVPTDAAWGFPGTADFAVAESWLGQPLADEPSPEALVRRYLAAFGPASVADAQTWSGLGALAEVFERLRPGLRTFSDERGKELFDLPKAPRPSEDTRAPARFLPEFDNLVLAHADRSRLISDADRPKIFYPNLAIPPTFLVDGIVSGTWKIVRKGKAATLSISPFGSLTKSSRAELLDEAERLVRFVEEEATSHQVRVDR